MNKQDIILKVAEERSLSKAEAKRIVNLIFDSMFSSVVDGEGVQIVGFGSFGVVERGDRVYRNPQTGEEVEVKAHKVVKFTPGKALKEAVH